MDNNPQEFNQKPAVRKNLFKPKKQLFDGWQIGKEYKLEKLLGSGSYGQVAQAIQLTTGKRVAIKRMSNLFIDDVDGKRMLREIVLLR